jgi:hypothetical protein
MRRASLRNASLVVLTVLAVSPVANAVAAPDARPWLPPTPPNWSLVVDQGSTAPTTVTRGISEYSETYDTVGGRQHTQVLDVDLTDPNVRLGVVEAGDTITDPADETVTSMAARTHAVAGVNGDFFEIHASGRVLKTPRPGFNAQLGVRADGSMVLGPQTFTGSVTDGTSSHALASVNTVDDVAAGGITEVTPDLGGATGLAASTLVTGHEVAGGLAVDTVRTGVTTAPVLAEGGLALLGGGEGGQWLASTVHPGETLAVAGKIGPDGDLRQLISGATMLVKDGRVYADPTGTPPGGVNPETVVGLTRDGGRAIVATLDGRLGASVATGVSPAQVAGYMIAHGAWAAVLFDGGGSTEMVGRAPGASATSVLNTPSDGTERPVANGLFFYSNEKTPGGAKAAVVNGGKAVTTVPGATVPVPVYGIDALGNPARGTPVVRVVPDSLGTWSDGRFTAGRPGFGAILAGDGAAVTSEPLRVAEGLTALTMSPTAPDLANGGKQAFTLSGTVKGGGPAEIPAAAASWSVDNPALGSVDASGVFTAAASGDGLATVTAKAGGAAASATLAVGSRSQLIDEVSDPAGWTLRNTTGAPAALGADPGVVPPGSAAGASVRLAYTMPAGGGVKQLVLSPQATLRAGADASGQDPTGIGLWVKGDGTGIMLAESYLSVDGTTTTLYPTTVTWKGWQLVVASLPPGLSFPLKISYLDFLAISPSQTTSGALDVSGLQALYSPRPVVTPPYQAIPPNPSWLRFREDSAAFGRTGSTLLAGDDAHLVAADPGSASSHVLDAVKDRLPALAPQARPTQVQMLGDMADDGQPADLDFARSKIAALGAPYRDLVGNHEISQGALPENGDFAQVFGDTHYAYTAGPARVIVTDSAHGSLQSSDAFQVPAEAQYPWLVRQLTDAASPAVVVATHMPAYDPHAIADSQFSDRWEARMYLRLVQRYQQTHPGKHVIMVYGHARGFSEQVLDPEGRPATPAAGGIPQLTIADLGMPAYAPSDEGGFYHFGLIHISPSGDVDFSVEPVLTGITVSVPSPAVTVGTTQAAAAVGAEVGGDNLPAATMPIADPASHVWTSSDPGVAAVDAVTGVVTAHHPGTATIDVTSGGVTGSAAVTVTG